MKTAASLTYGCFDRLQGFWASVRTLRRAGLLAAVLPGAGGRRFIPLAVVAALAACTTSQRTAPPTLDAEASATLARLLETQPAARSLSRAAEGTLIFPEIVKGGLVVGGATGKGVLRVDGETVGYYRSDALSYGLQAGITRFGYVAFFLDEASLRYLQQSEGWEIGVGPNVTVADEGFARKLTTTRLRDGVVVFFVDQNGFFAGLGIEGTKITPIAG